MKLISVSVLLESRNDYNGVLGVIKKYQKGEIIINDGRELMIEDCDDEEEYEERKLEEFENPQFVFNIDEEEYEELTMRLDHFDSIYEYYQG